MRHQTESEGNGPAEGWRPLRDLQISRPSQCSLYTTVSWRAGNRAEHCDALPGLSYGL